MGSCRSASVERFILGVQTRHPDGENSCARPLGNTHLFWGGWGVWVGGWLPRGGNQGEGEGALGGVEGALAQELVPMSDPTTVHSSGSVEDLLECTVDVSQHHTSFCARATWVLSVPSPPLCQVAVAEAPQLTNFTLDYS